MDSLAAGVVSDSEIEAALIQKPELKALGAQPVVEEPEPKPRKRFSKAAQAAALVNEVLSHRPRCPICNARMPPSSRSKDHIDRAEDGGLGTAENLRFTHPYCNSGYKEAQHAKAASAAQSA